MEEQDFQKIQEELDRLDAEMKPVCMHRDQNGELCCHPALDRFELRCKQHSIIPFTKEEDHVID